MLAPKNPEMLVCGLASWVWETRVVAGGENCRGWQQRALVAWEKEVTKELAVRVVSIFSLSRSNFFCFLDSTADERY
jgi:hypothetical protein